MTLHSHNNILKTIILILLTFTLISCKDTILNSEDSDTTESISSSIAQSNTQSSANTANSSSNTSDSTQNSSYNKPDETPVSHPDVNILDLSPVGFANVTKDYENTYTVSTKEQLIEALKKEKTLIYVNCMIDLSDGLIPNDDGSITDKLDAFVKTNTSSSFTSYSSFKEAYSSNCASTTNDKSSSSPESKYGKTLWTLNKKYGEEITIKPKSNTAIIGITKDAGFKGGAINLSNVSNVIFQNLTIKDAYDPFPHHEKNDGFNAQFDTLCIQNGSNNIWIDHCTFRDTLPLTKVHTLDNKEEKWQTYDGLLDIKGENTTNITVSYCRFENHDKTMLIGSSDTDWPGSNRAVTLHHNYFYNCGQRLPMVRQTKIHIFNNVYTADDKINYTQQYAIGIRKDAKVLSENNYFDSKIKYSFSGKSGDEGQLYSSGDFDKSSNGKKQDNFIETSEKPFTISYTYTLDETETLIETVYANAGAGFEINK